jgi:hypothetical protein
VNPIETYNNPLYALAKRGIAHFTHYEFLV